MIGGKYMTEEKPNPDSDGEEKVDMKSAKMEAARALLGGVKSGDVDKINDALVAHYQACAGDSE